MTGFKVPNDQNDTRITANLSRCFAVVAFLFCTAAALLHAMPVLAEPPQTDVADKTQTTDKAAAKPIVALPTAHAHNDYLHKRPLLDALDHGFCSVEADIFLVGDELLVGHFRITLKKGRTLEKLYLDPLRERIQKNGGTVHATSKARLTLLIDIKADGVKTYAALHKTLSAYSDLLTRVENGVVKHGAIDIVISGDRPMKQIAESEPRYCGIDGRLSDLKANPNKMPAHLMPLISDHWGRNFKWEGEGTMPKAERDKLHSIVKQAHDAKQRVRFWATPENENLWQELKAAKVDLLNTDRLKQMQTFLTKP